MLLTMPLRTLVARPLCVIPSSFQSAACGSAGNESGQAAAAGLELQRPPLRQGRVLSTTTKSFVAVHVTKLTYHWTSMPSHQNCRIAGLALRRPPIRECRVRSPGEGQLAVNALQTLEVRAVPRIWGSRSRQTPPRLWLWVETCPS